MDFLISEAKLSFLATVDKFSMWVLLLVCGAVLHTLLWTLVEFRLMLDEELDEEQQTSADASDKIIKAIVIAMIYFISAFIWEMLILAGVFQIWTCLNTTFYGYGNEVHAKVVQIIFTISGVLFLQGLVVKVTRWILGLIRGRDTLLNNMRAYKRMIIEFMEDEAKSTDDANDDS